MKKPQFRNNLTFVKSGYEACWKNATDLRESAELLCKEKKFALSLSVSVLAMEEIGKMMLIDGLLFARAGDYKAENFSKGHNKHQSKLLYLELFPFFVRALATLDSRYCTHAFKSALVITLQNFKEEMSALAENGIASFVDLDAWKQKGFYASESGNQIVSPDKVVSPELAQATVTLARRLTTTIDFLLSSGNIEKYFELASKVRASFSRKDWEYIDKESDESLTRIISEFGLN